jgi:hypothetical protein
MMQELRVSNAWVSNVCDIEETKLSRGFRGIKPLTGPEGERLMENLTLLVNVQNAVAPLSAVDSSNPERAKELLALLKGLRTAEEIRARLAEAFAG